MAVASLGFGMFGISQTTGAGWLTVLGSIIAGTLAVGIIWPIVLVRSVSFRISGPTDVVATRPFQLSISVDRPAAGLQFETVELTSDVVWAHPPSTGKTTVAAPTRGILDRLALDVTCSAPFDLFNARRRVHVALSDPIYVAPQPIPTPLPDRFLGGTGGDGVAAGGAGPGESVRGLREYTVGDAMRMVHWRASARRDDLLVKELEPPERPNLVLIVDVSSADAERVAGEAAGLVETARRQGHTVILSTCERAGPVIGSVGSTREAGRRLAAAVPGQPPTGPLPEGAQQVRVGRSTRPSFS